MEKSEKKALRYLRLMYPQYEWAKTAGGGFLDFMGSPPSGSTSPTQHVESKCGLDKLRDTQIKWAAGDFAMRGRRCVAYSPDENSGPVFLYPWDDYVQMEKDGTLPRPPKKAKTERTVPENKEQPEPASEPPASGTYTAVWTAELEKIAKDNPGSLKRLVGKPGFGFLHPTLEDLKEKRTTTWKRHVVVDGVYITTNLSTADKKRYLKKIEEEIARPR